MSFERGQVYFNHYRDALGRDRRIPVLIVSPNEYNDAAEFVTCVRMTKYNNNPELVTHVFIPASAFISNGTLSDCYAIAETISSAKKSALEGPIGVLASNYYMSAVSGALQIQTGAMQAPMRMPPDARPKTQTTSNVYRPSPMNPWYSAGIVSGETR